MREIFFNSIMLYSDAIIAFDCVNGFLNSAKEKVWQTESIFH